MKYKVLVGFSGVVSAPANAEIDIMDEIIAEDLLQAGYIEPIEDNKPAKKKKIANDGE